MWPWLSLVLKCWGRGVSEAVLDKMEPRALPASAVLWRRVVGARKGLGCQGPQHQAKVTPQFCGSGTRERLARCFWLRSHMCLQSSWPREGLAGLGDRFQHGSPTRPLAGGLGSLCADAPRGCLGILTGWRLAPQREPPERG